MTQPNAPMAALHRAVNSAIASGAPVYTEQTSANPEPMADPNPAEAEHRCLTCLLPVLTYRPTGTRLLRAVRHPLSAYQVGGDQCGGSFRQVVTAADVARDAERTARWRASQ